MPKPRLFADLGQTFIPFVFVCQWISVHAPEFLYHLALRHKWAFRLRIFEHVLQLAQCQLRARHYRRPELPVERVRRAPPSLELNFAWLRQFSA